MKSRIFAFGIIFLITVIYVGGCRRAGIWLVKEDVPAHADAMVLLMGSFPERVLEAADLYSEDKADKLIVVRESMGEYKRLEERGVSVISTTDQARDAAVKLGIPANNIAVLPGDAQSTLTEAIVVRNYLSDKPETDTLILVSSPAHMRRASMIFRAAFRDVDKPVYIGCSPSTYSDFDAKHWWRRKEDIQTALSEFVKMGSFLLFEKKGLKRQE
jgi:uncharacterized SAM-binding protein YcdF (DUF218 family)